MMLLDGLCYGLLSDEKNIHHIFFSDRGRCDKILKGFPLILFATGTTDCSEGKFLIALGAALGSI